MLGFSLGPPNSTTFRYTFVCGSSEHRNNTASSTELRRSTVWLSHLTFSTAEIAFKTQGKNCIDRKTTRVGELRQRGSRSACSSMGC